MKIYFAFFATTFLVVLSGCLSSSPPQSVNENPLVRIAAIDDTALFAADRDGLKLAISQDGLHLLDLTSSAKQKLSSKSPVALGWRPDGSSLAAAFPTADYEMNIITYSPQGETLHEIMLPIALNKMIWSARGDLLVTGFVLEIYSFGGDLQQLLYQINGSEVKQTVLAGSTLKRSNAKQLASSLLDVQPVAFSPDGDELVYVHLHDPPQFPASLELFYHNWQVGESRSLQKTFLQKLTLDWDKTESSVVVHSASGLQKLALWPAAEAPSEHFSAVNYRFVNGRLYDDEALLADWGEGTQLQVLSDGRFLLAAHNALYLGDGLQVNLPDSYNEKKWTLRRWRFQGLITPEEYENLLREESL